MMSSLPSVFYCTLLEREASRDDCHECKLGVTCAGIPSRLMLINRQAPVGPASWPQYPPTFPGTSAEVGVSGQRETGRSGGESGEGGCPHSPETSFKQSAPAQPAAAPQARRGKG